MKCKSSCSSKHDIRWSYSAVANDLFVWVLRSGLTVTISFCASWNFSYLLAYLLTHMPVGLVHISWKFSNSVLLQTDLGILAFSAGVFCHLSGLFSYKSCLYLRWSGDKDVEKRQYAADRQRRQFFMSPLWDRIVSARGTLVRRGRRRSECIKILRRDSLKGFDC